MDSEPLPDLTWAQVERRIIEKRIKRHGGVKPAARSLGISPRTVQRKLKLWSAEDTLAPRKAVVAAV